MATPPAMLDYDQMAHYREATQILAGANEKVVLAFMDESKLPLLSDVHPRWTEKTISDLDIISAWGTPLSVRMVENRIIMRSAEGGKRCRLILESQKAFNPGYHAPESPGYWQRMKNRVGGWFGKNKEGGGYDGQ